MDANTPSHAVIMWSDDNWIYVALPVKDNVPYICKFAFTEGGLSKALYVLRNARKKVLPSHVTMSEPLPKGYIAGNHPKLKKPAPKISEEQRAKALEIVRRHKR